MWRHVKVVFVWGFGVCAVTLGKPARLKVLRQMDPLTPVAFSSAGVIPLASPEKRLSEGKGTTRGSLRCHHTFQFSSCLCMCV